MQLRTCWCFGFLVLLASFLAGFLIWPSGSAQAQQVYPNCNFRCPANDVTITDAYAEVADSTCYFGQLVSTSIYVTFFNRANSSRYGVYFIADLYVDGAFVQHFDDCILDVVAPGTTTVLLISSVISCSENVEFRNVIVSWSQKTGGCGVPPECQERGAKCWMPPGSIVRVSPPFINDPPVANDDTATTSEDAPVAIDVVGNDFDVDGNLDATTVTVISPPLHGLTAVDSLTGVVTYTPDSNFNGTDAFSYQVCDSDGACDTALVTIIVEPVDDPPVANPDAVVTLEDTPVVIDVVANDYDVDGDLDRTSVAVTSPPTNGTVLVDPVTGDATYLPYANVAGEDTFAYQVCGLGGSCAMARVTVGVTPVNDSPTARDDSNSTSEDTPIPIVLIGNDADGDPLSYGIVFGPGHGMIIGFDPTTGELTYSPDSDYHGPDQFTFEVCDPSGACDTATVTLTVSAVDDIPVADPQSVVTDEDVPRSVMLAGRDADGDVLTFIIVSEPDHGTVDAFNPMSGEFLYTPDLNYSGPDSLQFLLCDPQRNCASAPVDIMILAVNDPPVAQEQSRVIPEDTPTGFFSLAITDPDNTLTELECDCVTPPENGTVERGPDHTVNYTPDTDFVGTDVFTYIVCDPDGLCDTATVTVLVTSANDNPSVNAPDETTLEETPVTILVTHDDPDGDPLACVVSDPAHGIITPSVATITGPYPSTDELIYTPDPNFYGTDNFTITCDDGQGGTDSATVEITVLPVNDIPLAPDVAAMVLEDTPTPAPAPDRDTDGDPVVYTILSGPNHGTLTGTGTDWVYTPVPDYTGPDFLVYEACDPFGACASGTVSLTVLPVNDSPVANDDTATTSEDAPVAIDVVGNDFDVDGNLDATTVTVISPPLHGLTAVDSLTGVVTYTPDSNFNGTDAFSYQVCDSDGACDTALVTIIVEPVDDPPVANPDAVVTLEDTPVVIDVVANDYDVDGDLDRTSVAVTSPPTNGTVLVDPVTGDATYLPYANVAGEDTFAYQVCDTDGMCDTATVEVFVEAANDAPVVSDLDVVTFEDTPIELLVEAEDPEGEFLVFMVPIPPVYGTVSELDVLGGKLTYVPEPGFAGADSFILQVCDASGGCSIAWVNVEVVEVNDPPDAICSNRTVSSGVPEEIELVGVDTDGDVLTYRIVEQPRYGSVSEIDAETGMISYVSEPGYTGPDWIVFEVCDSFGACDRCMIQLFVVFAAGGAGVAGECEAPIVISEVAWAGTAADPAHEWIELRNLSDERVDLEGWTLRWRRKQPETREDELWRAIRLEGIVESEAVKEGTRGYFLLERSIDNVVKSIPADLIYADRLPLGLLLELPDAGAVIELVDPYGCIADAANADHPERDGWAAGNRIVLATMERTDPNGPDVDRNWHTNNGVFVRGLDASGNPVIGTPRDVNSRPIVE